MESKGNPLALNVNGTTLSRQPRDAADAAALARQYIAAGYTVDMGLMQVNSANLPKLGYSVEDMFDTCKNLRAGSTVLTNFYTLARARYPDEQSALRAALSAYNTGSFTRGFSNGYVARYFGGQSGGRAVVLTRTAPNNTVAASFAPPPNPFTATTVVFVRQQEESRMTREKTQPVISRNEAEAPAAVEIGQRARFTPNEERAAQGGMTIEGVVVDAARTQAGNIRYRIRTDEIAPQDGQPQEWLVYTNHGSIEQLPARGVEAGPTPEAAAALEEAHRNAVPTYSPLETWQNLEATARELGLVAAVRLNPDPDAREYRANFQVSYTHQDGTPSAITTGIFMDGKALTGVNGERVSPFITEDHESQSIDLRTALTREREQRPPVLHEPPEVGSMTPQRTYLIVPYREKDTAKKAALDAGFRLQWDKEAKQWFAPEGIDVKQTALARWLPENTNLISDELQLSEVATRGEVE